MGSGTLKIAAATALAGVVAAASSDLANALSQATFLNSGVISAADTYAYVPIACGYLEAENVTAAQSSWGQGGGCPYLYKIVGEQPPSSNCNASAPNPGYDRMGGDYKAFMLPNDDFNACLQSCCDDMQCQAWVYVSAAPGTFMDCQPGSHCCFLKSVQPAPSPSTDPGITSGTMNRPQPQVSTPPVGLRSAVPLGGVGAGTLELRGDGTVHEVTILNQSPAGAAKFGTLENMMFGLRVTPSTGSPVVRSLRTSPPAYAAGQGVDSLTYSGSYPMSRFIVGDAGLAGAGVQASLYAYSTLKPGDFSASSTPAAVFTLVLNNTGSSAVTASFMGQVPWGAVNDCARPAQAGMNESKVNTPDAASCMHACFASPAATCNSWYWSASGTTCTLVSGVAWSVYREGVSCGVRGGWAAPVAGAGLVHMQGDARGTATPATGDLTLLPVLDASAAGNGGAATSFGIADDAAAVWQNFSAAGGFSMPGNSGAPSPASIGAASVTSTVPAGSSLTLTLVLAWYYPHRDHMSQEIGQYYSTIWDSSQAVAASLGTAEALTGVVTALNAHHAVFASPGNPMPDWLQDHMINQHSHFRHMIALKDGRLREFEANDCPDLDSIHNDYQRHLPYFWSFPEFDRSKIAAWGGGQAADGHIWEYLGAFSLSPVDEPGGRIMGDTTTLFITEIWEYWRTSGDLAFLQEWWPTVARALAWQAGPACVNHGQPYGLPYGLVCTYDIIDFQQYNTTTFNSYLHLLAMQAGAEMAAVMGDSTTQGIALTAYNSGVQAMGQLLWNSTFGYWRAYTGGEAIMADCLYGVMLGLHHGLGFLGPAANASALASHLANELKYNGNAYGLAVVTGRNTPPPVAGASSTPSRFLQAWEEHAQAQVARAAASPMDLGPSLAAQLGLAHRVEDIRSGRDTTDDVNWMGAGPDWSYVKLALDALTYRQAQGDEHAALPPGVLAADLEPASRSLIQYRTGLAEMWNVAGINSPADWSARPSVAAALSSPSAASNVTLRGRVYAGKGRAAGETLYIRPTLETAPALLDGLPYITSHYGFMLTDYYLIPALTGQQSRVPNGTLTFSPLYPCPYTLPLLMAGATGTIACSGSSTYTVSMAFGSLSLPAGGLAISGSAYPGVVSLGPGQSVTWTA